MILTENVNVLNRLFPDVLKRLNQINNDSQELKVDVEVSKTSLPTLLLHKNEQSIYVHSKYNPIEEAGRFVDQYQNVENYQHVFFYGIGLGYHIEAFINKYPGFEFSIYEPSSIMLTKYLEIQSLQKLPLHLLKNIYIENDTNNDSNSLINRFVNEVDGEVLLVIQPAYQRFFQEKFNQFSTLLQNALAEQRISLQAKFAFEKRWTVNSLINLPETFQTPNILLDKKEYFKDKPALLVAAGPSLEEEIENIRFIKENSLAYIFSVGATINALLKHGITPDAICTYDPTENNNTVFRDMVEQGNVSIPLVYGTPVAFEVLQNYPGTKLHMLTSKDAVSPFFLRKGQSDSIEVVYDSPSIAGVTLSLLIKLECSQIIFVGQNLAYRNDRYYAQGVSDELIKDKQLKKMLVEDVNGQMIQTHESFYLMKKSIEIFTSHFPNVEFINTTQGGAKIEGTTFLSLKEVIKERLKEKVVVENWSSSEYSPYESDYTKAKLEKMNKEYQELTEIVDQLVTLFKNMNDCIGKNQRKQIEKLFPEFDDYVTKMQSKLYYQLILFPMNRTQYEFLNKKLDSIRYEQDICMKAQKIIEEFGSYVYAIKRDMELTYPIFEQAKEALLNKIQKQVIN